MGGVLVDRFRELAGEAGEKLLARQACLLRQRVQHVGTDRLLQSRRVDRLIRALPDPRLRGFTLSGLREALEKLTEAAAEETAGADAGGAEEPCAVWTDRAAAACAAPRLKIFDMIELKMLMSGLRRASSARVQGVLEVGEVGEKPP